MQTSRGPTRGRVRGRGRGLYVRDFGSYRPPQPNLRAEKSLGVLTERFVQLLQESPGGTLDLRQVFICILFTIQCYIYFPSTFYSSFL